MKKIDLLLGIAVLLFIVGIVNLVCILNKSVLTPIDLPKGYKSIVPSDRLIGYFDKDSVLHIEFDNSIQLEWEGLEKDIPKDGEYIQITGTDENIVYLNPIDE